MERCQFILALFTSDAPRHRAGSRRLWKSNREKKRKEEKERSPLIRAKDQSTAWHSSFRRGCLALSYIGVPLSRSTTYPMRVYIGEGRAVSTLLPEKSVIRWWQTEAMACTAERGRRRCRCRHSFIPNFATVSTMPVLTTTRYSNENIWNYMKIF